MRFRALITIGLLGGGLILLADARAPRAQSVPMDSDTKAAAATAIGASLDVELDILRSQQEIYRQAAADRDAASRKLTLLLADLDAIVQSSGPVSPETTAAKEKEIAEVESRRSAAIVRCREVLGRIFAAQERVAGLEKKLTALRGGDARVARETVSGSWQVLYLPGNNKGVFAIRQSGTLLQGVYQLDGGWKGSLQGTFIDGRVYLQRIDS